MLELEETRIELKHVSQHDSNFMTAVITSSKVLKITRYLTPHKQPFIPT